MHQFFMSSANRLCRLSHEIRDNRVVDRLDNAMLDGSDVHAYLQDNIKRQNIGVAVIMTMIWEYVFTRYLFGLDREMRQKLKALEYVLREVGKFPPPYSPLPSWVKVRL